MYFGEQTYYTLKVSHTAFLLKSCKVVYQSDDIKNDDELTRAFDGVLQSMVELDNPKAAVILDEFRIH